MDPSISRLLTSLELAWASCTHDPTKVPQEYGDFLRLLLAAPVEQGTAAVVESRWLRDRLRHWDWATVSTPDEMAQLRHLMALVLTSHLSVSGTSEDVEPFIDSLRSFTSPELVPLLGQCMRRRTLRATTARLLAHMNTPDAWATLRLHDGPDLDDDMRAAIAVHDPAQSPTALAALLGPKAARPIRSRALLQAMRYVDPATRPDLVALILQCFDEGFDTHYVLNLMSRKDDPTVRRHLFDRLWPIAQSSPPRPPWREVNLSIFYDALLRTAPAVELVAASLDSLDDRDAVVPFCDVLARCPDPIFVPTLERWYRVHKTKGVRHFITRALDACRRASA